MVSTYKARRPGRPVTTLTPEQDALVEGIREATTVVTETEAKLAEAIEWQAALIRAAHINAGIPLRFIQAVAGTSVTTTRRRAGLDS